MEKGPTAQTWAVRRYLEAIAVSDEERVERVRAIRAEMPSLGPLERVDAAQRLVEARDRQAPRSVEEAFVECAGAWGSQRGISAQAWEDVGVPTSVLRRAGIS